jgi:pimeloyl-ACP methyl ester carboxylesterase
VDNIRTEIIEIDEYSYEYFVNGHLDNPVIIAFNGFGKNANELFFFEDALSNFKIIAVNLLYHGNSCSPHSSPIAINEIHLHKFICRLIEKEKIIKFSLLGYSLGCKIALKIFELLPQKTNSLILLSPDGIKLNTWYNLATKNLVFKAIFKLVIKYPFLLFATSTIALKTGIIKENTNKFIRIQMDTYKKRKMVYDVWLTYPDIIPNLSVIKRNMYLFNNHCLLIYGKYDSIIPPNSAKNFIYGTEKLITLRVLKLGHNLIHDKSKQAIKEFIQTKKEA